MKHLNVQRQTAEEHYKQEIYKNKISSCENIILMVVNFRLIKSLNVLNKDIL